MRASKRRDREAATVKAPRARDRRALTPPEGSVVDSVELAGWARIIDLPEGSQRITIDASAIRNGPVEGLALPITQVMAGPDEAGRPGRITLACGQASEWLPAAGGAVVAEIPPGGGVVVVTTYGIDNEAELPAFSITQHAAVGDTPETVPDGAETESSGREIAIEVMLHIAGEGDRRAAARGWVGNLNQRRHIEGFGLRPLDDLRPGDIEYMGFGLRGRRTAWVTDSRLCGTRGRSLPLTGFAVRLTPAMRDRFEVIYEGSFFSSGPTGPSRDGEPCLPLVPDDPLQAIKLRVIERPRA